MSFRLHTSELHVLRCHFSQVPENPMSWDTGCFQGLLQQNGLHASLQKSSLYCHVDVRLCTFVNCIDRAHTFHVHERPPLLHEKGCCLIYRSGNAAKVGHACEASGHGSSPQPCSQAERPPQSDQAWEGRMELLSTCTADSARNCIHPACLRADTTQSHLITIWFLPCCCSQPAQRSLLGSLVQVMSRL